MLNLVLFTLKLTTYEEVVAWRMTEPAYTPKSFQSMGTSGPCTVSTLYSSVQASLTLSSGTSKHNPSIDTYGHHGRFISSLSALSLLSITSQHRTEADERTISFHESQV